MDTLRYEGLTRTECVELFRAVAEVARKELTEPHPDPGEADLLRLYELAAAQFEDRGSIPDAWAQLALAVVKKGSDGQWRELLTAYQEQQAYQAAHALGGSHGPEQVLLLVRFRDGSQRALRIIGPTELQVEAGSTVDGEVDRWAVRTGTGMRSVLVRGCSEPLSYEQLSAEGIVWTVPGPVPDSRSMQQPPPEDESPDRRSMEPDPVAVDVPQTAG